MNLSLTFLLSFLALIPFAAAENRMVFFGGGDSRVEKDKFFLKSFKGIQTFSEKSDWNSELYYSAARNKKMTPKVQDFNPESFDKKIKGLIADIQNNKIKKDDQLLLYIDTHGANYNGEHYMIADYGKIDTAQIEPLIQAAEKAGVRLGIVASACYTGNLIKKATSKTCIITAAQNDRIGFSDFSEMFNKQLNQSKGKSLEELYLLTRKEIYMVGQPMISTETGEATQEILEPLKKGIFHSIDLKQDIKRATCSHYLAGFEKLKDRIGQFDKIETTTLFGLPVKKERKNILESLKKKMEEYAQMRIKASEYIAIAEKKTCFEVTPHWQECGTVKELAEMEMPDVKLTTKFFGIGTAENSKVTSEKEPLLSERPEELGHKEFFVADSNTSLLQRAIKKLQNSDDFINYSRLKKDYEYQAYALENISQDIGTDERILYTMLYEDLRKKKPAKNACSEFKF